MAFKKAKKKAPPKGGKPLISDGIMTKPHRLPQSAPTGLVTPEILESALAREHATARQGPPSTSRYIPPGPVAEPGSDKVSARYLRWSAGVFYTTSLEQVTLGAMAKHSVFSAVTYTTLRHWAEHDNWGAKRKANLERWQRAIENKIESELIRARQADLEKLRGVYEDMFLKLKKVEPRTYEGMVGALVKLAELMDQWAARMSREMLPDAPASVESMMPAVSAHTAKPSLTSDEARAAARAILEQRRKEREAQTADDERADGDETQERV